MLTIHDATLDDIHECMRTHRTRCGYAFHDQCREWHMLQAIAAQKANRPPPPAAAAIVNDKMYVLVLDEITTH